MIPRRNRARTGTLALAGLALGLTACSDVMPEQTVTAEQREANERAADELAEAWRRDHGFPKAVAQYTDDIDTYRAVQVDVTCRDCAPQATAADLVGEVWASEISPLTSIDVQVFNQEGANALLHYVLPEDEAELTQEYGARSVPNDAPTPG